MAANLLLAGYNQLEGSIDRIRLRRQLGAPSNRLPRERITALYSFPKLCQDFVEATVSRQPPWGIGQQEQHYPDPI